MRITKGSDNGDSDNRGSTLLGTSLYQVYRQIGEFVKVLQAKFFAL